MREAFDSGNEEAREVTAVPDGEDMAVYCTSCGRKLVVEEAGAIDCSCGQRLIVGFDESEAA